MIKAKKEKKEDTLTQALSQILLIINIKIKFFRKQ